jgi:nucleotide-binding universal stress UspA family protein
MNTIAALTDFSPAADNALRYAAMLAQKTNADLTVLHAYQLPVSMNDIPVMYISADELKKNADKQLREVREALAKEFEGLRILTESLLGDVVYEVEEWGQDKSLLAVVIGSHESTGAERLFFGNTAASIVRRLSSPVITVPQSYTGHQLFNAVLATDLSHMDAFPAQKIVTLLQQLNLQLEVVHIDEKEPQQPISINGLEVLQPRYNWIQGENVNQQLLQIIQQPENDLLIILPHEHNLIERLFFRLHAENLIQNTSKPILSIRD